MSRVVRTISVIAVAVLALGMASCGANSDGPTFVPAHSSAARPSPTPSSCHLRAIDQGFSVDRHRDIEYAAIIENPCPGVATNNEVTTQAVDGAGKKMRDGSFYDLADTRDLPTILPGQKLAVVGTMTSDRNPSFPGGVKSITVTVGGEHWQPLDEFDRQHPHWARAKGVDVRLGARGGDGGAWLSFNIDTGSSTNVLSNPSAAVVMRDHANRIVSGHYMKIGDPLRKQKTGTWVPANVDRSRTEVYINQKID